MTDANKIEQAFNALEEAIKHYPADIQALAREFPPGYTVRFQNGESIFVAGYADAHTLAFSRADPSEGLEKAQQGELHLFPARMVRHFTKKNS